MESVVGNGSAPSVVQIRRKRKRPLSGPLSEYADLNLAIVFDFALDVGIVDTAAAVVNDNEILADIVHVYAS